MCCLSRYFLLSFIIATYSVLFSQESEPATELIETQVNHKKLISEISILKIKFIEQSLDLDELFRLASFYLSAEFYGKSAELYGLYIDKASREENLSSSLMLKKSTAHYNRALSLFTQCIYGSSLNEFQEAYQLNPLLYDALRMGGTASFLQEDLPNTIAQWEEYLDKNKTPSRERSAVAEALKILKNTGFSFSSKENPDDSTNKNNIWPFLNPDRIPSPNAQFEKKRVI